MIGRITMNLLTADESTNISQSRHPCCLDYCKSVVQGQRELSEPKQEKTGWSRAGHLFVGHPIQDHPGALVHIQEGGHIHTHAKSIQQLRPKLPFLQSVYCFITDSSSTCQQHTVLSHTVQ